MAYVVDLNQGWNSGARSTHVETGDCVATFSVPDTAAGVVCGFSSTDHNAGYRDIEHGLMLQAGFVRVVERAVFKTALAAFVTADVFTIRRAGGVVQYLQNGTLLYTSATASTGTIFLDSSLYIAGDEIR